MLQAGLELIVHYPEGEGYRCRGFQNLRLAAPAYVVFEGAACPDQSVANLLGRGFCRDVLRYTGAIEATVPCRGNMRRCYCHAMAEPTCRKILVYVAATGGATSSGHWLTPSAAPVWQQHSADPTWQVLPVMPAGGSVETGVPPAWRHINVCFWNSQPEEVLWAVLQRVGLCPEESRIFISYVRQDTVAMADQLFVALSEAGFDVFLDRCSVPVGVPFQERLMQELCDKAMMVLLNTGGVANSHWVEEEIALAKIYRLGLLEVRLPDSEPRPDVDADFSRPLEPDELEPATGGGYAAAAQQLRADVLTALVNRIKEVHGLALYRRRWQLADSFVAALTAAGKTAQALPDGTFVATATATSPQTWISFNPRPPELGHFCGLHRCGNLGSGGRGWIVSPAPFFLAQRQAELSWLGGLSSIQHADEAQIPRLVADL